MTRRNSRKQAGLLGVGLLAGMLCTSMVDKWPKEFLLSSKDLKNGSESLKEAPNTLKVTCNLCSLEKLRRDLGICFRDLEELSFNWLMTAPEISPTKEERENAAPCKNLKYLGLVCESGSPKTFEWIKLFFPNIERLNINMEGLPIGHGAAIEETEIAELEMKNLKELHTFYYTMQANTPSLDDNLKLFPELKTLIVSGTEAGQIFETMMNTKLKWKQIECLKIDQIDTSKRFLTAVMEKFPSLKELSICGSSFKRLIDDVLKSDQSESPFKSLVKLGVNCNHTAVKFDSNMSKVFPSVTEIEMKNLPLNSELLSPNEGEGLTDIKKVTVVQQRAVDGKSAEYYPSFFGELFPNLESLSMANCDLYTIFSRDIRRDERFFARLKQLDISNNRRICTMDETEKGADYNTKNPKFLFGIPLNPPIIRTNYPGDDYFAEKRPEPFGKNLEILDFRYNNSPYRICYPPWLFQAFPNIKTLRVSEMIFDYRTPDELRKLLEPLIKLEFLDVEVSGTHILEDKDNLVQVFFKLKESLKALLAVRFFTPYSSAIAKEICLSHFFDGCNRPGVAACGTA